jgi:hypothetical protein
MKKQSQNRAAFAPKQAPFGARSSLSISKGPNKKFSGCRFGVISQAGHKNAVVTLSHYTHAMRVLDDAFGRSA